ncbi:MAG: hypothetical protein JW730_07160 [Anaerolineales bacterium]|nr:hypothetical protein [Anaerolineales bacterium]
MDSDNQINPDERIRELESQLCRLAMEWRSKIENRQEIKEKYRSTLIMLFSLGWDDVLDIDCELPTSDMPQEYLSRHPYTSTSEIGSYSWNKKRT